MSLQLQQRNRNNKLVILSLQKNFQKLRFVQPLLKKQNKKRRKKAKRSKNLKLQQLYQLLLRLLKKLLLSPYNQLKKLSRKTRVRIKQHPNCLSQSRLKQIIQPPSLSLYKKNKRKRKSSLNQILKCQISFGQLWVGSQPFHNYLLYAGQRR